MKKQKNVQANGALLWAVQDITPFLKNTCIEKNQKICSSTCTYTGNDFHRERKRRVKPTLLKAKKINLHIRP